MRKVSIALVAMFIGLTALPVSAAENTEAPKFSVMSRNLYLGADVAIAMELLPDFPAATQFMWDQMRKTDFPSRSKLFVAEIARTEPDVIGLQEATKWYCKSGIFSDRVDVYDFVQILLSDLSSKGLKYEVAQRDNVKAQNVGFEIAPIPLLTKAHDSEIFPSLFGSNSAYCGFEIADVLLIKSALNVNVLAVGTSEFDAKYTIIPTVMSIYRGYSWADVSINSHPVRFVTTHLESSFSDDDVPVAKVQVDQLIKDLSQTKIPLVVMGDFNSDPRDPRPSLDPNPGLQPSENTKCGPQVVDPNSSNAITECNAYWSMIKAGFNNVGPDPLSATNFTWGMNALLTGPDENRLPAAIAMGNPTGFTDRLDYVFTKGKVTAIEARLIGQLPDPNWASDHAGVFAILEIPENSNFLVASYAEAKLPSNSRFPLGFWEITLLVATFTILARIAFKKSSNSAKKATLST